MASWQVWQLALKVICIGIVMLVEQVIGMPILSLLLLYWWFGRRRDKSSIMPIALFSIAVGLLYGGTVMGVIYVGLSLWWWVIAIIPGVRWLRSLLLFCSTSIISILIFGLRDGMRWEFVWGWLVISAVVWWRLNQNYRGITHVS